MSTSSRTVSWVARLGAGRREGGWPGALLGAAVACWLGMALLSGCGPGKGRVSCYVDPDAGLEEEPVLFTDVDGNHQTGFVGQVLPEDLRVRLVDRGQVGRAGVEIVWSARSGPRFGTGAVDLGSAPFSTTTDTAGEASLGGLSCTDAGGLTLQARPGDGAAPPVYFRVTCFPQPGPNLRPLTVVHFNDLHTHATPWRWSGAPLGGLARLATLLRRLRASAEAGGVTFLAANSGDDFENTLVGEVPGAISRMLVLQDRMGVDVFQVGNHDYHFGLPTLLDVLRPAAQELTDGLKGHPMVYLLGNVDPSTLYEPAATEVDGAVADSFDATDVLLRRTWVLDDGALRIGVIGVVTDVAIYTQVPGDPPLFRFFGVANPHAQGLTFIKPDPRESDYFAEGLDYLDSQDVDFIACTSHSGLGVVDRVNLPPGYDHLIAQYAQGASSGRVVDTVLSAHSHIKVNHAILLDNMAGGKTSIIQADEGAVFLSRQDFMVDTQSNTAELIDSRLLQVDRHLPEDAETAAAVQELIQDADNLHPGAFDTHVAYNERLLSSRIEAPCALGRLIARSFLYSLGQAGIDAGLAVAVPSLYRIDLEAGVVTPSDIFDVLPLHKMDDTGTKLDTITYLELKPGLFDATIFGMDETERLSVPAVLYFLELLYGLFDVLEEIYPQAAGELDVDVVQIEGVSFDIDVTAPPMQRIDPDSLEIGGEPVDTSRTYRVAIMESLATVAGPLVEQLVWSERSDTGQVEPLLFQDQQTERFYFDSQIPLWESLLEYVSMRAAQGCGAIPAEDLESAGEIRSLQPDVSLRHTTLTVTPRVAAPGDEVTVSVDLTNYGVAPVGEVRATLYYDSTPWDDTDNPDGLEQLEGLSPEDQGSYVALGEQWVRVKRWPATGRARFRFSLPQDMPPYRYPLFVALSDVVSSELDPNTGVPYQDVYRANDGGPAYPVYLSVVAVR